MCRVEDITSHLQLTRQLMASLRPCETVLRAAFERVAREAFAGGETLSPEVVGHTWDAVCRDALEGLENAVLFDVCNLLLRGFCDEEILLMLSQLRRARTILEPQLLGHLLEEFRRCGAAVERTVAAHAERLEPAMRSVIERALCGEKDRQTVRVGEKGPG